MNTANLQLEGLVMAIAHLNLALVRKGVLSSEEMDELLRRAEAELVSEERAVEELTPANRDAIAFPVRLLKLANRAGGDLSFSELAKRVGRTKEPYNDQR